MYAEKFRYWGLGAWNYVYGATFHDCRQEALDTYGDEIEPYELQRWTGSKWVWFV